MRLRLSPYLEKISYVLSGCAGGRGSPLQTLVFPGSFSDYHIELYI